MKAKVTFGDVAKVAQDVQKRGTELWATMCLFVAVAASGAFTGAKSDEGKALKLVFKENETSHEKATETNLNTIGAYRSAKSVINAAARYGVGILDAKGNARGKSEVEGDLKKVRQPQSAFTTIQRSFSAIEGKLAEVTDRGEAAIMFGLAKQCFEKVKERCGTVMEVKTAQVEQAVQKEPKAA